MGLETELFAQARRERAFSLQPFPIPRWVLQGSRVLLSAAPVHALTLVPAANQTQAVIWDPGRALGSITGCATGGLGSLTATLSSSGVIGAGARFHPRGCSAPGWLRTDAFVALALPQSTLPIWATPKMLIFGWFCTIPVRSGLSTLALPSSGCFRRSLSNGETEAWQCAWVLPDSNQLRVPLDAVATGWQCAYLPPDGCRPLLPPPPTTQGLMSGSDGTRAAPRGPGKVSGRLLLSPWGQCGSVLGGRAVPGGKEAAAAR